MGATIGESFSPHRNSLNLLRLVLATTVVVSHTIFLGGYASDVIGSKTTLGTLAVYGFFGISGYLIAGSASRNHVGRYLWQRVLRIFPGFWVCLLVTAFVFGLIGWFHSRASCGLSCYLRAPSGPLGYIGHNSWLKINQPSIAHTLTGAPAPQSWNGSLWTLFYEFLCYLLLAALALLGMLRRRWTVLVLTIVAWLAQFVVTVVPSLNSRFDVLTNWQAGRMLIFVPAFLTGSLIFLYQDRIPDSRALALACAGLVAISLIVPLGTGSPGYSLTSTDLFALALAYPLIWLGTHLPFQRIGSTNDYSYGVYIYAYPVSQLLALWGIYKWGYVPYTGMVLATTIPFAVASWWLVEKRALRLKRLWIRASATAVAEG